MPLIGDLRLLPTPSLRHLEPVAMKMFFIQVR